MWNNSRSEFKFMTIQNYFLTESRTSDIRREKKKKQQYFKAHFPSKSTVINNPMAEERKLYAKCRIISHMQCTVRPVMVEV